MMSNWLDEFINSRLVKRIVLANYMGHLKLKTEGRNSYANIEEALEDFASRTGLSDTQKRALRRQVFVKIALDMPKLNLEDDLKQIERGQAPAAILPGVKPGSEEAKKIKEQRKQPFKKTKFDEPQESRREVEDNAQQKAPGSSDADAVADVTSNVSSGLIIEAAEDEWEKLEKEEKKPTAPLRFVKPQDKKKSPGGKVSKEKKLLLQIQELQTQLVKHYMDPGGSISQPKYRKDLTKEERRSKIDVESEINEISGELADLRFKEEHKKELESPRNKALVNDTTFLSGFYRNLGGNEKDRANALRRLSPEGLQHLFDTAVSTFRGKTYHRPSQGYSDELGDYVKCMVCDGQGKFWINVSNPSILPFKHIEEHSDILLTDIDLTETDRAKYREEIINSYLKMYPGAALQSREQELASMVERIATQVIDQPQLHPPHVATETEKDLDYSDTTLTDMILYQFRRFGVDPDDKTTEELARETLNKIKERLNEEFPEALGEPTEGKLPEIGKLVKIPFEAFHRAFREEIGNVTNEYRGSFSDFKPPTKRQKRRWTSTEREVERQKRFKQLRKEDVVEELAEELGHTPSEKEIRERLREKDMVPVKISVTGGRTCWNCGQSATVYVDNNKLAINSATCPNCGVYREVLMVNNEAGDWKCSQCGEQHWYVVRDPNEGDLGGTKVYVVHCDENKIGDGAKSVGNSRFVKNLKRAEREIHTEIEEPEPSAEQWNLPVQVGEQVVSVIEPDKYGRVVYVEGSLAWVDWNDKRKAKVKDLKGQVAFVSSKDPNLQGYNKVVNITINEDKTVKVDVINEGAGKQVINFPHLGWLEAEAPIATQVTSKDIKKIDVASRRHNRVKLSMKIATVGCSGFEAITVDRYTKEKKPETRSDLLRRFIRRARILCRLGVK